jgi:hypothetical protein
MFEKIHPSKSRTTPFLSPSTGEHAVHFDVAETRRSIEKLTEFDAYDNVLSVIAHDQSLFDIVEFYPKPANEWKAKGWAKEGQWRFLGDFDAGSENN